MGTSEVRVLVNVRTILAFALAPLATPLFFLVVGAIQTGPMSTVAKIPSYLVVFGPFAYAATMSLGVVAFWLRPRRWDAWPYYYIVCGVGIGLITALVLYSWGEMRWASTELFSLSSLAGGISGFCFWMIGIRREGH